MFGSDDSGAVVHVCPGRAGGVKHGRMNVSEAIGTARLLIVGGLPVCAAIVSAFAIFGWRAATGGPPLEDHDFVAAAVFVGVAGVGLAVALRATWRLWRDGASDGDLAPMLARVSPLLLIVGGVGGVLIGTAINRSAETALESSVGTSWCEDPNLLGFYDVNTCVAAGIPCLHDGWVNAAPWQAKADAFAASLQAKRAALMAVAKKDFEQIQQIDRLDRMLSALAIRERTENRDAARRAGIGCMVDAARH